MIREEARQIIADWLVSSKGEKGQCGYIEGWFYEKDVEAFRMAIEALSADAVQGTGRYENAMRKLREMPRYFNGVKAKQITKLTADKVVRCKDCKWHECGGLPCPLDVCEALGGDGFCSKGERKGGDTE